ncbi:MAG: hypothetical protein WBQ75_18550 [Acetobacteraceae bacterium]
MLLATGLEVIGHCPAAVAVPRGAASQRLLRRLVGAAFITALLGIGLAFPIV